MIWAIISILVILAGLAYVVNTITDHYSLTAKQALDHAEFSQELTTAVLKMARSFAEETDRYQTALIEIKKITAGGMPANPETRIICHQIAVRALGKQP